MAKKASAILSKRPANVKSKPTHKTPSVINDFYSKTHIDTAKTVEK